MAGLEDELGDITLKARTGLGITVQDLAGMTGVDARDIARIESYQMAPDIGVVRSLAQALRLDPDKLAAIAANAWHPQPPDLSREHAAVETVGVSFGGYLENCYILACRSTRSAAVVDPGGSVREIMDRIAAGSLRLEMVLITHAHHDHVGGLEALVREAPGVTVVSHRLERNAVAIPGAVRWEPADESVQLSLGSLNISILHTPGHTSGSTCYAADGFCFVGDTLFAGSIGRPASRGGYEPMLDAIRGKVLSLPRETTILPGHGPATTISEELLHNPFF